MSRQGFAGLTHMRSVIDNWRDDDHHCRPHSTLGNVPPARWRHIAARINDDANLWTPDRRATQPGG
ncbi:MAG: integrase core domain-containing protein [Thiomonas sp.]